MARQMTERTIKDRLNNWASAQRGHGGTASSSSSITGIICDRMRLAANGSGSAAVSDTDQADAERINRAWQAMRPDHRELLKWYYVRNKSPSEICRRLEIKHFPRRVFDNALGAAEDAMEVIMGRGAK